MTATTFAAPTDAQRSWTQAMRVALIALTIVILVALSFVVGRASVSSTHLAPAPLTAGQASADSCHIGRAC